jgi:plastocyanin/methionine-rich copper-binding protein CopC
MFSNTPLKPLLLLSAISLLAIALLAACGDATATPTTASPASSGDSMMDKGTPTGDAMMDGKTPDAMMDMKTPTGDSMMDKLPDQIFAAHFVDSSPAHGETFAQVPTHLVINFNFTLHHDSTILVTKGGQPVSTGPITFGDRDLSISTTLPSDAGDGLYTVDYNACWPDQSCHKGRFAFYVDSKKMSSYVDMTGQPEVAVNMQAFKFDVQNLIVSKGTKVTWVNNDSVDHFVNTDPHPTHNAYLPLNSLDIKPGQSYSITFNDPGEYTYHCSAHYPSMVARVIVK